MWEFDFSSNGEWVVGVLLAKLPLKPPKRRTAQHRQAVFLTAPLRGG